MGKRLRGRIEGVGGGGGGGGGMEGEKGEGWRERGRGIGEMNEVRRGRG